MTKEVTIKNVKIGNGNPVAIQSMTNTKTGDVDAMIAQINALKKAGCDIVRFTVNDAALRLKQSKTVYIKYALIPEISARNKT